MSLKKEYGYRCQVCNERIKLGPGWYYAEVHHIRPLGGKHRGSDTRGNMLVLCPNHHAMFDYGAVRFESADALSVDGRACKLTLKHELSAESRDYHNQVIARVPAGG